MNEKPEDFIRKYASFEFEEWKKDHPDQLKILTKAMQEFGNQRFNAALSEAIEKVEKTNILPDKKLYVKTVFEILEGLKIKP